ncbi:MAG: NAD/NADP octopine/nopaline dehydrogenase family protein [Alphaproteobacteria bacterium]|nr:NAD/NADP octopine/nopaline dehydrogenase family protein [Alphaproteobacteria bacterium]
MSWSRSAAGQFGYLSCPRYSWKRPTGPGEHEELEGREKRDGWREVETVAFIGAGIGGIYLATELGIAGFRLRLCDIDESRLTEIRARGGLEVEGERAGFAAVKRATTNLAAAVEGADLIILVTGGNAQPAAARSLAPVLRDGQAILLIQGNTGGSLVVRRALYDAGGPAGVDVAEMDNYPYSCWRLSPTRIRPIARKRWLQIASFPGNRIDAVFARLASLFPQAVAAPNILYTGFTNANAMLHVANCVANAARIESGDNYRFYAEGVTPAVARLYEATNAERVAVAAALGTPVPTLADWFDRVYGVREATLDETSRRLTYNRYGPYQATGTPKSLDHKFITEDVPTGLIPMSALGSAAGVRTPAIDALVELGKIMTGDDFAATARTLDRLGLSGMDIPQIRRAVDKASADPKSDPETSSPARSDPDRTSGTDVNRMSLRRTIASGIRGFQRTLIPPNACQEREPAVGVSQSAQHRRDKPKVET